jgi:hypothetical protein
MPSTTQLPPLACLYLAATKFPVLEMATVLGSSSNNKTCHNVHNVSTVFTADSAIPNMVSEVSSHFSLASILVIESSFS